MRTLTFIVALNAVPTLVFGQIEPVVKSTATQDELPALGFRSEAISKSISVRACNLTGSWADPAWEFWHHERPGLFLGRRASPAPSG